MTTGDSQSLQTTNTVCQIKSQLIHFKRASIIRPAQQKPYRSSATSPFAVSSWLTEAPFIPRCGISRVLCETSSPLVPSNPGHATCFLTLQLTHSWHIWEWKDQFWRDELKLLRSGGDPGYRAPLDTTLATYDKTFFRPDYFSRRYGSPALSLVGTSLGIGAGTCPYHKSVSTVTRSPSHTIWRRRYGNPTTPASGLALTFQGLAGRCSFSCGQTA